MPQPGGRILLLCSQQGPHSQRQVRSQGPARVHACVGVCACMCMRVSGCAPVYVRVCVSTAL